MRKEKKKLLKFASDYVCVTLVKCAASLAVTGRRESGGVADIDGSELQRAIKLDVEAAAFAEIPTLSISRRCVEKLDRSTRRAEVTFRDDVTREHWAWRNGAEPHGTDSHQTRA